MLSTAFRLAATRGLSARPKSSPQTRTELCPKEKKAAPKKSFWSMFKGGEPKQKQRPPLDTCRKRMAQRLNEPDPDLSEFGGQAYRTCGPAYLIQREVQQMKDATPPESEDRILAKIETHPSLKDKHDPMPAFESVEQRLIDLCEKRLHPLYKRYLSIPEKPKKTNGPKYIYKSRSGPVHPDEIPAHLKFNKECLERKNIFSEFKRVEPPRQLLAKMLEIRKNEKPTMEKRVHRVPPRIKDVKGEERISCKKLT